MSELPAINYLQKRGSTYQFRMRVPLDLIGPIGKTEIKVSLRTRDPVEAKRLARLKAMEVEALFELRRNGFSDGAFVPSTTAVVMPPTADGYYRKVLETEQDSRHEIFAKVSADPEGFVRGAYVVHPRDDGYFRVSEEGGWRELLAYCFRRNTLNRVKEAKGCQAVGDISDYLALADGSTSLARMMQAAEIKALEDLLKNAPGGVAVGDVAASPVTPFSDTPRSMLNGPLLSVASEEWLRAKAQVWPEKTLKSRRAFIGQFIEIAGDKAIDAYVKADVRSFRSTLEALPPNWSKSAQLGKLGLVRAAVEAERLGLTPTKPKNVNNIITSCSSCFSWLMKNHDELVSNPFTGVRVEFKEDVRGERDSFSAAELRKLFTSEKFLNLDRASPMYWVPLIALHTGMRATEICQLYMTDIRNSDGVEYLDNNLDHPDKRLKTASSKRRVPIHSNLVSLGFLDFVRVRKAVDPLARLFPDVALAADGYYSSSFSKWFSRFLKGLGLKRDKLTFHSFRHTFEDAARLARIDHAIMNALQGHSAGDMSDRYGGQYPLTVLNDELQKISYEEVWKT